MKIQEHVEPASDQGSANGHADNQNSPTDDGENTGLASEDGPDQPLDISRKFFDWRTAASFLIALVILAVAISKFGVSPSKVITQLKTVNPVIYLGAFVVYYLSFPLRTFRWKLLMLSANTGADREKIRRAPLMGLMEILYLSWFANVVIPAKLGDVYRAYLTRTSYKVSASRTVGTVLAERILDFMVLFPLLLISAFLTFHNRLFSDSDFRLVLVLGFTLLVLAIALIVAIWRMGDSLQRILPKRIHHLFDAFREGAVHSFRANIPALVGLSIVVWMCEGGRVFMVLWSMGMIRTGEIGPSAALFLALGSSLLTTLPITPGGLGIVDPFLIAAFRVLGVKGSGGATPATLGGALDVLDRVISYVSLVVFGFVLYVFSKKTKAALSGLGARPASGAGANRGTRLPDPMARPEQTRSIP